MKSHRTTQLVLAGAIALMVSAGCSEAPRKDTYPAQVVYAPAAAAKATSVEMTLAVAEDVRSTRSDRHLDVRWGEHLLAGPDGAIQELVLSPERAARSNDLTNPGHSEAIVCPREVHCRKDASKPAHQGMQVALIKDGTGAQTVDEAEWHALLESLLLFEELAYAVLPRPGETPSNEWEVNLDAEAFAKKTRLGAWAEDGIVIRGVAGLLPTADQPGAGGVALRAVMQVKRASGQDLRLVLDIVFDPASGCVSSATVAGLSNLPASSESSGAQSSVQFTLKSVKQAASNPGR